MINVILQEEVISSLIDFGLERTDALLYITLLQVGPATVNTISSKLGMDKGKVYRAIHKLQDSGFISSTFSNPTVCQAIKPEKALEDIIQRKEEQILVMQKTVRKIANSLMQFENPHNTVSQMPSLYVIQGRPNIYTRIAKLIEEATQIVYVITTARDLLRMNYTVIPEKMRICKRNSGQIRIVIDGENFDKGILKEVEGLEATEVRVGLLPSKSRIVISQGKRLLMSGSMSESMSLNEETDSTLYTNSHEIVDNMFSFCSHIWSMAKPLEIKSVIPQVNE
ncbi:MAG: hypothetical protein HY223_00510 [Thaumarchaeota archaeon]|nr:hypothetical protein [Nitrososphaerota archaeon]